MEIARELYSARKALDARGHNLPNVPSGTTGTGWRKYLVDCGLEKSTVHRWLELYIPDEDRLMTTEEHQEVKAIEERKAMDRHTAIRHMVIHRVKTGNIPKDWDDEVEKAYQRHLKDSKERQESINQFADDMERKKADQKKLHDDFEQDMNELNESSDILKQATDQLMENLKKRSAFKEKIRLSSSSKNEPFIDALIDYLETLEDDNRRLQACNDIIKITRRIAVELHQKKEST